MNKQKIHEIFSRFRKENPEPKTELNYINDYTLLVAIVCSAQATDIGVNKATEALFKKVDNPYDMLKLGEDGLKKHIKTIGLFNGKAKNVIKLSKTLIDKHCGKVPDDFDSLIELAGVGRKTANVFLNCFHGHLTIGVDTHVFRVSNRIGITKAKNEIESENQLLKKVPREFLKHSHHWLILHGRYICKARKPECEICSINDLCDKKGVAKVK